MAVGTQLGTIVDMVRNEIGESVNPAFAANSLAPMQNLIRRMQETLYYQYDWPHLIIDVDTPLNAGQRYYTFDPLVNFNRIYKAYVYWSASWQPLMYGIQPTDYNYSNPDLNQRSDAALKWNYYGSNQFEIWPVPAGTVSQKVRFRCTQQLPPLFANSDTAVIDDRLISLYCASEMLSRSKQADAVAKQQIADRLFARLKNNEMKRSMGVMGGGASTVGRHDWKLIISGS